MTKIETICQNGDVFFILTYEDGCCVVKKDNYGNVYSGSYEQCLNYVKNL